MDQQVNPDLHSFFLSSSQESPDDGTILYHMSLPRNPISNYSNAELTGFTLLLSNLPWCIINEAFNLQEPTLIKILPQNLSENWLAWEMDFASCIPLYFHHYNEAFRNPFRTIHQIQYAKLELCKGPEIKTREERARLPHYKICLFHQTILMRIFMELQCYDLFVCYCYYYY